MTLLHTNWLTWSTIVQAICLFVVVKFCTTIYSIFNHRWKLQELTKDFDKAGLETTFLFGNMKSFPPANTKDYLDTVLKIWTSIKTVGCDWLGPFVCMVMVVNPEHVKLVLADTASKDNLIDNLLRPWFGDSVLLSEGAHWKRHRRLLTPAFHFKILRSYVQIFTASTDVFLDKLSDTNGKSVDVCGMLPLFTLDTLLQCLFSYESNCQIDEQSEYIKAVVSLITIFQQRFSSVPYHYKLIFHLSPIGFKWRRNLRICHKFAEGAINKKQKELKQLNDNGQLSSTREHYLDFLDGLLMARDEDGAGLTNQEINAEVNTFMFAGHETTASAISWCFYNLARFPIYQQKCRDEVESLLHEKAKTRLDWDDLKYLPFTTMFIKESFRVHPPVPRMSRSLTKDVALPNGTVLPKGTCVSISPLGTHHHPSYWEDPEVFDPYRFLPERSQNRHSHAYIPFSAGPRNCIGQAFAMSEVKVALAMTLLRFEVALDPDKVPEWTARIVLMSLNGIHLKFIERSNQTGRL